MAFSREISHLRSNILRKYIWVMIYNHVFSGLGKICHGRVGQAIAQVLQEQRINQPPLLDSRYLKMISQLKSILDSELERENENEDNKSNIEEVVLKTAAGLQAFISPPEMQNFETEMKNLIIEAINPHAVMMKSKAIL